MHIGGFKDRSGKKVKIFAYIVSALIGFAIGHYLLSGAAAAFASILISYHLYLGFLILSAQHEKGFSLPVGQTILTHMAFLVVVIGLPYLREQIPFFYVLKWLVPALAPFETQWLFSGQGKTARKVVEQKPVNVAEATAADHQAFLTYLRGGHRAFRKPGASVDDEFKAWLTDRVRKRAAAGPMAVPSSEPAELD